MVRMFAGLTSTSCTDWHVKANAKSRISTPDTIFSYDFIRVVK